MTQPNPNFPGWHGTTILAVRRTGLTVIAGDGQVSMGPTIVKGAARKVRTLADGRVLAVGGSVYGNGQTSVEVYTPQYARKGNLPYLLLLVDE